MKFIEKINENFSFQEKLNKNQSNNPTSDNLKKIVPYLLLTGALIILNEKK